MMKARNQAQQAFLIDPPRILKNKSSDTRISRLVIQNITHSF